MAKFSKVNEAFVPGPDDTENDVHKGEDLVHEAEQVQLEVETHDLEKDVAGYGDADVHGCWHRFVAQMRMAFGILDRNAFYVTQTMQDALMNSQVDGEELSLAKATSIDDFWKIYKLRCQYFKGFWNIIDIMVILLASLCAGFNICRTYSVNKNLAELLASPDVYPNFERLSYWEMQFTYAVGVLVFLVYIKIFKYVSFNKTMNQLNLTLAKCAKDIAGFGVMFFIVFFAFAQLGYLAFGTQVTDFATFAVSLLTLFRIILGDFDFQALHDANSVLGPLYFLVYIFFVFFVLINMFIAIINDTYLDVKSNLLSQPSEVQMKSFFKKRLKEIRKKTKQNKAQLQEIQNVLDAVDTDEKDMTIDDFKSEMKDSAGGLTLEQVFKRADVNSDMKLSPAERSALKKSLETRKMEIIQDMVNYQEAQLGQSFEQVAKFFADKTASKEEVNQAFSRLIRLENCIRTVTERIRAMSEKLESVEEAKSKRPDRLAALLENMVANVSAVEKKALETEDEMMPGTGTVEEDAAGHLTDGVRNRSQGGISQLLRSLVSSDLIRFHL
nr:unnamed protein product [Spirometra erinaceieuropaei]